MSSKLVVRARDAIDIVEAAYSLEGSDADWLGGVLTAARRDLDFGGGTYAFAARIMDTQVEVTSFAERGLDPKLAAGIVEANRNVPQDVMEMIIRNPVLCAGVIEFVGDDHPATKQVQRLGIADAFSLMAHDGEGWGITMTSLASARVQTPPRVGEIWRRVAIHVASAGRLRRRLAKTTAEPDALLDPGGAINHAEGPLRDDRPGRRALTAAVRAMERARSQSVRSSPDRALELWKGLVAGRWSLVDHWESDGRRYLAAFQNRPEVQDPRALSPSERAIVKLVTLGVGNKDIAFRLGLSLLSVETSVKRTLRKLGCGRRSDLVALGDPSRWETASIDVGSGVLDVASVSLRPRHARFASLTAAEQDVAGHVVRGATSDAIAKTRGTSPHTVRNQIRAIFEALGVSTRAELVHLLTSTGGD